MDAKRLITFGLWIVFSALGTNVYAAAEARCNELGANCVCSEPFNTGSFTYQIPRYIFTDSGKPCNANGEGGQAIRNTGDLTMSNDPGLRGALTTNPFVTHVLRGPEGHINLWYMGHLMPDSPPFEKRVAMRWYLYHSPNYEGSYDGACTNQKWVQNTTSPHIPGYGVAMNIVTSNNLNSVTYYNFYQFYPGFQDCCWQGPQVGFPNADQGPQGSELRGKWWRLELVMTNIRGGNAPNGARIQLYMKNITDNQAERLVIDSNGSAHGFNDFTPSANLTPMVCGNPPCTAQTGTPAPIVNWRPSLYRESASGGGCKGFNAVSHFLLAGWATDGGQRIGAASEVEGGGGPVPELPAPPGLLQVF